jgi:ubiquinone/menaquinone biosynthesis C-methylase UbiE
MSFHIILLWKDDSLYGRRRKEQNVPVNSKLLSSLALCPYQDGELASPLWCYNIVYGLRKIPIQDKFEKRKMPNDEFEITRVKRPKESARAAYDRLSKWYDLLAGSSEKKFADIGLQKLDVNAGETILEIGFGTGGSLVSLAQLVGSTGKVYGVDLSTGMFRVAQNKLKKNGILSGVRLQCADATHLPYPDSFLDAVFMSFVLELFDTPELPLVLRECERTLRGYGRIGVVALSKQKKNSVQLYEWFHMHFPAYVDCRPIYARETIEKAGFQIMDATEMSMWGLPVEIVVAQKTTHNL